MKRKVLKIFLILIIIAIFTTLIFFSIEKYQENKVIEHVYEVFNDDNVQDRIDNSDNTNDLSINIDGEDVVGIIKIDKIGYEGLVYEGTTLETLAKGVGHFKNSSYLEGNVCLAAHNTDKFWSKLYTLQNGDKITYTSMLGTKTYYVFNIKQIEETDWSLLKDTDENILTLVTCVKGKSNFRLCVQALEKN